jgi:addiction module HigA family antidote
VKGRVPVPPPTPGTVLRDLLLAETESQGRVTQDQLASAMRVSRVTINQIVNGRRAVTAEMALRLGKVTGTTPQMWLRLQQNYDLHEASLRLADELDRVVTVLPPTADEDLFVDLP